MRYMLKKSLNQSTSSNRTIIVENVLLENDLYVGFTKSKKRYRKDCKKAEKRKIELFVTNTNARFQNCC